MMHEQKSIRVKTLLFLTLFLTCLSAQNVSAQSPGTMPPNNIPQNGPPPGEIGNPPGGPMMEAAALEDKTTSDYFIDLDASTASINAYIDYLFEKKIITDPEGMKLFHPKDQLSRQDLALMLFNKYKYAQTGSGYDDIPDKNYAYMAVINGKASRIFEDGEKFFPNQPVTKGQLALWLYRSEINNGMPPFMVSSDVSAFKDGETLSEDMKKAVATLARIQVLKADADGNFNASAAVSRTDIVGILYPLSFLGQPHGEPGKPGGPGAPGGKPGMMPGMNPGTVDHGSSAYMATKDISSKTFSSVSDSENALRADGDVNVVLTDVIIEKTGGQAAEGDACNFYGSNAAFLAMNGSRATINNSTIKSSTHGGNGIFSYGKGTEVIVNDCTISTTQGSSGGIMVTGGGKMNITNSQIETQGRSSAALRTDRGGGVLTVKGGTYTAHGEGSPSIYSTADIKVSDATLTATSSEAVVIEGKNSVALKDCIVSGNMRKENVQNLQNIMIYQSMSGDAEQGRSSFSMEGGSLTSHNGDMLYVTNTSCNVKLQNVLLNPFNDIFLKVVGNDARNGWGVIGKNGGTCNFEAINQKISGKIIVDQISSLEMTLTEGSQLNGSINNGNEGGKISLHLDNASKWKLTGDSYLSSLSGEIKNIDLNGHKLVVDGRALE